ncbi:flagellar hook-length control protein FliK [Clostridiales bacterium COT073_COT-073]|nr:flagellar hook-length control protein FliK [Clostridiales bacterium COT073_COT-073]
MATPTINTVSAISVGKISGTYQSKAIAYEGANSFQGFLQKSSQPEKTVAAKGDQDSKKAVSEEIGQPLNHKKNEIKPESKGNDQEIKVDSKAGSDTKSNEKTELSSAESQKIKEFVDKVQTTLDLSPEEMQAWLGMMGMQVMDLLDAGKLQNFFMQVKGIEVSDLLTEANQAAELKTLLSTAAELEPLVQSLSAKQENGTVFNQMLEEAIGLMPSDKTEAAISGAETNPVVETNGKSDIPVLPARESNDSKNEMSGQQNLPKEAVAAFDKVVQTEEQIMVTADGLERVITTVSARDIYQQVVTKFTAENLDGASKVTIQLNPEHLGKLAFQVVSRGGQMTGQFVAESEAVKTALEAQVSQLKLQLANQGIRVEDVKVVVGDTANYFTEDKPKEHNQETAKKRNRRIQDGISINTVEEEVAAEEIKISTGTIDFTA